MMNGLSLEPQSCTLLDSFKRKRAPISTCSLDNVVTDVTVHLTVSVKTDTAGSRYSFQFESNANGRRRKLNKTQNRTLRKRKKYAKRGGLSDYHQDVGISLMIPC